MTNDSKAQTPFAFKQAANNNNMSAFLIGHYIQSLFDELGNIVIKGDGHDNQQYSDADSLT